MNFGDEKVESVAETSLSLIERAADGSDPLAWSNLCRLYHPLLLRWANHYGVQHADAEDVVQQVFVALVRELPKFEHNKRTGAFRRWLRQILVYRLKAFWSKRKPTVEIDSQMQELADDRSELSRQFDVEHDEFVMQQLLRRVSARFDEVTCNAFHLNVLDGKQANSVAEQLGISVASVYAAKSRIMKALRREAHGLIEDA